MRGERGAARPGGPRRWEVPARWPAACAARGRARALGPLVLFLGGLLGIAGCRAQSVPLPSRIVDLSPALTADVNVQRLGSQALQFLGSDGRIRSTLIVPSDPAMAFGLQALHLPSHSGTHLDTPARLLRGGDRPADVHLDQLFGPAHLVDLRWHTRHSPIQITDLELARIMADEIVLLLVGYEPPQGDDWPRFAPLSAQASEWLAAKQIRALATDMPALVLYDELDERMRRGQPPESIWAEYLPLFQARIPVIVGLVNLEALARERNIVFAGFPMPLTDADGAPVRAAALVY